MEKVAISWAAMPRRSSHGSASEHHLAHHELSVIFSDSPGSLFETGIWQIGTLRPLPSFSPHETNGCCLPFQLGRQAARLLDGKDDRLVVVDMRDRLFRVDRSEIVDCIVEPLDLDKMPVE